MEVTQELLDKIAVEHYGSEDNTPDMHLENVIQWQGLPKILRYIKKGDCVLEMGVGDGVITPELIKVGIVPDIIEGSKVLAERAEKNLSGVTVCNQMFEDFVPKEKYDVVLCMHVLEHVENVPKLLIHIKESWLKEGGRVVAIVPNAESLHRQLAVDMKIQKNLDDLSARDKKMGHLRVYNMKDFKSDFKMAGFKIDDEFGSFIKTVPNSMMLGYKDDLTKALCNMDYLLPPHLLANIGVCASIGEK